MVDAGSINFASGKGRSVFKGGGRVGPSSCALSQVLCRHRRALALFETAGVMAWRNPFAREGNHGGHLPRRLEGDRGARSSGAEEAKARANGQGDEDPGERWFRQENSRAKIRTLTCLEGDLNSALLFEHGGGQRANQLLITCILLGRLSRERTALGKAMEVFATLQQRDIMQSMVKLHDLWTLQNLRGGAWRRHRRQDCHEMSRWSWMKPWGIGMRKLLRHWPARGNPILVWVDF